MTKSEQILRLYDGKRSTSEIAAIVGCRSEYVRVVARQRVPGGHDANKEYIRRIAEASKVLGDRQAARRARSAAYRAARASGLSISEARSRGGGAYTNMMRKTCIQRAKDLIQQS